MVEFSIFRSNKPTNIDIMRQEVKRKQKRFYIIHTLFKVKMFLPFLRFIEKRLGSHMVKKREDIPDEPYNRNFFILYDSFEEAARKWWWKFKGLEDGFTSGPQREADMKQWYTKEIAHWYRFPKLNLDLWLTMCLEDTAYREFMNVWLYTLYQNMLKAYHPDKPIIHPMYIVQYDNYVPYFTEWCRVAGHKKINIELDLTGTPNPYIDPEEFKRFSKMMEEKNAKDKGNQAGGSQGVPAGNQGSNNPEAPGAGAEAGKIPGGVPDKAAEGKSPV